MEQLKHNQPPERAAQFPGDQQLPSMVQITPSTPDAPVESEDDDDIIAKPPSWEEHMGLLESQQSALDILGKHPKG